MTRFNGRIGAGVLVGLGVLYLVLSLVSGHSARAEVPPPLTATEAGINVWQTLNLMLEGGEQTVLVDVRPAEDQATYRIAGSTSLPGADAAAVREGTAGKRFVVLIASNDEQAAQLASATAGDGSGDSVHYLQGGVRSYYLGLELPAPLFSSQPPPHDYPSAMAAVKQWLTNPGGQDREAVKAAIAKLAQLDFQPDQLAGKPHPKASGKNKKISGGCG